MVPYVEWSRVSDMCMHVTGRNSPVKQVRQTMVYAVHTVWTAHHTRQNIWLRTYFGEGVCLNPAAELRRTI